MKDLYRNFLEPLIRRYLEPNWLEAAGVGIYIAFVYFAYRMFEPPIWIAMLVVLVAVPIVESGYYYLQNKARLRQEAAEREGRREEFEQLRAIRDEAERRRQAERQAEEASEPDTLSDAHRAEQEEETDDEEADEPPPLPLKRPVSEPPPSPPARRPKPARRLTDVSRD